MVGFASLRRFFAYALCLMAAIPAQGAEPAPKPAFKPALIYLAAPKTSKAKTTSTDNAFIDSARAGMDKASSSFGISVAEYPISGQENISAAIKRVADSGANPILLLGAQNVAPVLNLAERYPNTQFTVIDGLVPPIFPNVQSILFKDNEGAFLVGLIAAKVAKGNHIGFIGGIDSPQIRNFAAGYKQGAKYANPQADVMVDMIGTSFEAWNNPEKARALAIEQYNNGAEVIFAAAGGSSLGVLSAAKQAHKYAIGVDINQNGFFPGYVLTSMVKRVDVAVYDSLKHAHDGSWSPGIKYLGIKEGALDYAVDENNRTLLTEDLIEDVASAKDRIINGIITVETYSPK